MMKFLSGFLLVVLLAASSSASLAGPATLCVDPDDAGCFSTIQAAVDAAVPMDTIEVRAKADGTPYRESVVVNTKELIIQGETVPNFDIDDFDDLLALDWATERANCPVVGIDVCETAALGEYCGFGPHPTATNDERTAFVIDAPSVFIRNFTIRHALTGIRFSEDSDNGQVERSCFIHNRNAVVAGFDGGRSVGGLIVTQNRLFGVESRATDEFAIEIHGTSAEVTLNLLRLSEGIRLYGDDHLIQRNTVHVTGSSAGIDINNGTGYFVNENWIFGTEDDGIDLFRVDDSTVVGNLVTDVPDDDEGIGLSDSGNNLISGNIIRATSNPGINVGNESNGNTVDDNTLVSIGSDSEDDCIALRESTNNLVSNNSIELCNNSGIGLYEGSNFTTISSNDVQWNATNGVLVFGSTDSTINLNTLNNNKGEGINHGALSTSGIITNNTALGNRTDICNSGGVSTFSGNVFLTGGVATPCLIRTND